MSGSVTKPGSHIEHKQLKSKLIQVGHTLCCKHLHIRPIYFILIAISIALISAICTKRVVIANSSQSIQDDNFNGVRDILFVGRSRSGKSTVIQVLKDVSYSPQLTGITRSTLHASIESFNVSNTHFRVMDTPGLFERTNNVNKKRSNELILQMIRKCLDMKMSKLNHVYFVMSLDVGLNGEDVQAFELFSELFVGKHDKLSIVLSFTQMLSIQAEYDHYIKQFQNVNELRPMYDLVNGRIFFLGAAQKNEMVLNINYEEVKENVGLQRNILLNHMIEETQSFNVKELPVYTDCQSDKTCAKEHKLSDEADTKVTKPTYNVRQDL